MGNKATQGAILGAILLAVGSLSGRSYPIANRATNTVYINSKSLESSEKISKISEIFEKLDINTATLQQFKDAKVGIGEKKFKEIKANRPFSNVSQLREKGIVGFYTYKKLKIVATVGGN